MSLTFLPQPRSIAVLDGAYGLTPNRSIILAVSNPQAILFTARRIQQALQSALNLPWGIAAGWATPPEQVGIILRLAPAEVPHPQGYRLQVLPDVIKLTAHDEAGLFYAAGTLSQLLTQAASGMLPGLEINDWPDFPARGVMLDISRDRVPQMANLYDLVDRLSSWKINQLQLYTEHTFMYRQHPEVWAVASPMTGEDILALDAYCRERYVELVPNQNSFGHMERWLKHSRYAPLAETLGEIHTPWNTTMQGPFSLAPLHPGSLELLRSMYDELLPHFSSRMINVGCDETVDLGQGQSQEACQARGIGRVYLDFLLKIYTDVTRRGYQMQFWGDIINDHPELTPELPKDAIGLLWGYEADHPFNLQGERFARAHVPFYVCPGTSAWNTLAGRTDNAIANLTNAAENGIKFGACGFLNTNWGDGGHWQAYPVTFLGYAAGAAFAWCLEANRSLDFPQATGRFTFGDDTGSMGKLAYDLGNLYQETNLLIPNQTALYWVLHHSLEEIKTQQGIDPAVFARLPAKIDGVIAPLDTAPMACPDAALIRREFASTARLMRHACQRVALAFEQDRAKSAHLSQELKTDMQEFLVEYQSLWLARSRPGGLPDSRKRFEELIREY
jgi:hypothetical protein